jgi:hypothetical protein
MDEHRKARALICVLMQGHGYNTRMMVTMFISRRNKDTRNYDCDFCTKYVSGASDIPTVRDAPGEDGYMCSSCRCIFHSACVRQSIVCSNKHVKTWNYVTNQRTLCEVCTWYSPSLVKNWHKCIMCRADICDSVKLKCDQAICHACLAICDDI